MTSLLLRRCTNCLRLVDSVTTVTLRNSAWYKKPPPIGNFSNDCEPLTSKTTMDILNDTEDSLHINSYSTWGFKLNNNINIIGPAAIFPTSFLQWNVQDVLDIHLDSLSLFTVLEPKIDILLIGVGEPAKLEVVDRTLYKQLRDLKLGVEIMPTHQACSLFNFLNAEKRMVAAALIPPNIMPIRYQLDTAFMDDTTLRLDWPEDPEKPEKQRWLKEEKNDEDIKLIDDKEPKNKDG